MGLSKIKGKGGPRTKKVNLIGVRCIVKYNLSLKKSFVSVWGPTHWINIQQALNRVKHWNRNRRGRKENKEGKKGEERRGKRKERRGEKQQWAWWARAAAAAAAMGAMFKGGSGREVQGGSSGWRHADGDLCSGLRVLRSFLCLSIFLLFLFFLQP